MELCHPIKHLLLVPLFTKRHKLHLSEKIKIYIDDLLEASSLHAQKRAWAHTHSSPQSEARSILMGNPAQAAPILPRLSQP